mgnify:CR=1 FL=1
MLFVLVCFCLVVFCFAVLFSFFSACAPLLFLPSRTHNRVRRRALEDRCKGRAWSWGFRSWDGSCLFVMLAVCCYFCLFCSVFVCVRSFFSFFSSSRFHSHALTFRFEALMAWQWRRGGVGFVLSCLFGGFYCFSIFSVFVLYFFWCVF